MADAQRHELSSSVDRWQVTLKTGDVLEVRAHAVKESEGFYVFVALMEGRLPTSTTS
jgi:hypothetical protein